MQPTLILDHYWDLFIAHTCQYHAIDRRLIDSYAYEMDWSSLSKNKLLDWDLGFLEQYEDRFNWTDLAMNEAISWTADKILRFKKRLDWYYLGRNKNIPITPDFIEQFSKQLFVSVANPMLNEELKNKYQLKIIPAAEDKTQSLTSYSDADFETVFNGNQLYHNQRVLYQQVFLPIIEEKGLDKILEDKFDYTQRYYFLEPLKLDIHGLTPEFVIEGANPFEEFREDQPLFRFTTPLKLVNGSLQEGPARLYEMLRYSGTSCYPILIVSEHVRSILEQFRLPAHTYHPVELHAKKITTTTKYFILQLVHDTLNKELDYTDKLFLYRFSNWQKRGFGKVDTTIRGYPDYLGALSATYSAHPEIMSGLTLFPDTYRMLTDLDLYTFSPSRKIIINQYLKNALERNFPGQLRFQSAQQLRISIPQDRYDQKAAEQANLKLSSTMKYQESDETIYYTAKATRLQQEPVPPDPSLLDVDKFRNAEEKLMVIFPAIFKNNYLRKALHFDTFNLLPIAKFYTADDFTDRHPETVRSVVIAENGVGDSIRMLLEKESDFRLQNRFFRFDHETGEYEDVKW